MASRFELDYRRLLCGVGLVMLIALAFGNEENGLSIRSATRSGESVYQFRAQSSIGAISMWVVSVAILAWTSRFPRVTARRDAPPAGLLRRLAAMSVDLMLYISVVVTPIALLALGLESQRTGAFAWQVSRAQPVGTDGLVSVVVVLALVALLVLYALPFWRGQQSFGDAVLGIAILTREPPTMGAALARTMLAYVGVCAAFITVPAALQRSDRRFWPDGRFGVRAIRLSGR